MRLTYNYSLNLFIRRFCAAWLNYRVHGHFVTENCEDGDEIAFDTQMANWNGLISCV